ncbi:MAG: glucose-1-phosphate thymidylyltransferase [Candidatus Berkelbacteria bacterium Gr01-1014_85]|uniref:glucose-1-phosphate thymidylyltransferase n=1 Tax=Candidatus Berkelbacteria bacterium Gr01-1014_85 TaxID=2017150 RepID=A0A554JDM9_9BACT|nr:MAG: glucose-1-phosphate thymidylyltransferase [Candidatus Berkelbacteria bacterium Gr01-1014_85]
MKGIVLAGGKGSRLYPMTHATNKHLLPIYDQPMIYYPIQTLTKAGITEIAVLTGGPHAGHMIRVLKNGHELGVTRLDYIYQEGEGGIAQALGLCERFADGDSVAVILGDNTTDADIGPAVQEFQSGAKLFLKEVNDPERFGVAVFDPADAEKIIRIDEKPAQPASNMAVTGLYIYDNEVFEHIKNIKPSNRGELEITDVNNRYIEAQAMSWSLLDGFWSDAGKPESLFRANAYYARKQLGSEFDHLMQSLD